jgi:hypothetical protein
VEKMDSKLRRYYEIPLNLNKTIVESGICVSGEILAGVAGYFSGGVRCKKVTLVAFSTVAKKFQYGNTQKTNKSY